LLQRQFQLIFFSLPSAANTRTVFQRFLLDTTAQAAQVDKKTAHSATLRHEQHHNLLHRLIITNTTDVCQAKSGAKKPLAFWRDTEENTSSTFPLQEGIRKLKYSMLQFGPQMQAKPSRRVISSSRILDRKFELTG